VGAFSGDYLGPLGDGQTAVIIGGGPSGAACAIALKNLAVELGRKIEVIIYEGKTFAGEIHHNQCVGVLSPPLREIMGERLGVAFPDHLVQTSIGGYVLHSDRRSIVLEEEGEPSYVVKRVQFDDYLLGKARERGVRVVQCRVTDLEFAWDRVVVYSEGDNRRADVLVGAFGLDDGAIQLFQRATTPRRRDAYAPPRCLDSIVTRIYPDPDFLAGFGDRIHAFLPAMPRIEFGAVTPKHDHLTVNIAGAQVDARLMDEFLTFAPVKKVLPPSFSPSSRELAYFKGRFPVSLARGYYNDRYVVAGDAAGLLRPFKGKGVTYGCITGIRAAETIMKEGISKAAFRGYERKSQEVLDDMIYGRIVRWLAIASAYYGFLDPVLEMAKNDHALRRALFDAVSAHKLFKEIVRDTLRPGLAARLAAASALALLGFQPRSS